MFYSMKKNAGMLVKAALACSVALTFQGCSVLEWFNTKTTPAAPAKSATASRSVDVDDVVYATIGNDNKPFITKKEFDVKLNQMLQAYRGQVTADALPMEAKRKFLDDLAKMRAISAVWADDRNIASDPAFQSLLAERIETAKEAAIVEQFVNELRSGIEISESEVSADYKKNKDRYVKVAGGATIKAVSFSSEKDADAFLKKAQGNADQFEALANKESDGKFKDFGFVPSVQQDPNMGMMPNRVPDFLKDAVFAAKKFPAINTVSNGQQHWVFCATDKKDSVHFELAEIKDQLREMLKENKFKGILDERMKEMVRKAHIKVNEEYFKRPARQPSSNKDEKAPEAATAA